ncbi:polysaccharide deacetylase family protein [Bradyrhizobium japonicum]|uniref:polysaccharide deacetylase family protein n=1 Tax=Bradyrhizobium japonicum TaxID=375 RepID=UPI0004B733F7
MLAALAGECARATFFLVGRSSAKFPELVRRIAALGHTIAHHSFSHPIISKISFEQAKEDIELGIAADEMALNGVWIRPPVGAFLSLSLF